MPIATIVSILPDDVPSAAGVSDEFVREFDVRDVLEKGGDAAAAEEEPWKEQGNEKPKRKYKP